MMRLSDFAAGSDFSVFGIAATLLALAAFVSIVVWTFRCSSKVVEQWARQPLDDDQRSEP